MTNKSIQRYIKEVKKLCVAVETSDNYSQFTTEQAIKVFKGIDDHLKAIQSQQDTIEAQTNEIARIKQLCKKSEVFLAEAEKIDKKKNMEIERLKEAQAKEIEQLKSVMKEVQTDLINRADLKGSDFVGLSSSQCMGLCDALGTDYLGK